MALPNGADAYQVSDGNPSAAKSLGGTVLQFAGGVQFHGLSTAITANSTTTTAPVGSIATTTNATGTGKMFVSDGTKWQFAVVA